MPEFSVQNHAQLSGDDREVKSRVMFHRIGNRAPVVSYNTVNPSQCVYQFLLVCFLSHKLNKGIVPAIKNAYSNYGYFVVFMIIT